MRPVTDPAILSQLEGAGGLALRTANAVPVGPIMLAGKQEQQQERQPVTDPETLALLEGRPLARRRSPPRRVTDPALLARLEAAKPSRMDGVKEAAKDFLMLKPQRKALSRVVPTIKEEIAGGRRDIEKSLQYAKTNKVGVKLSDVKPWETLLGMARAGLAPVTGVVRPLIAEPAGSAVRVFGGSEKAAKYTELGAEIAGNLAVPGLGLPRIGRAATKLGEARLRTAVASSVGAASVTGAKVGMAPKLTFGEKVKEGLKTADMIVSPFVGGRSVRALDDKAKLSPTLAEFRNKVEHPQEFELPPGAVAEKDFTERVLDKTGAFRTEINNAIDTLRSPQGFLSGKSRADLASQLRTGASPPSATTPVAQSIRGTLEKVYAYEREAGLNVGYVENYLPRVYNEKVKTHEGATAFINLLRSKGFETVEADDILRNITENDGVPFGAIDSASPGKPSWMKRRELTMLSDEELAPFLINDPRSLLDKYVRSAVRRAEHARIFGPNGEKLTQALPQIRQEVLESGGKWSGGDEKALVGLSQALIGQYKNIEKPVLQKASRAVAGYQFLRTLPMATLSSLSEPFIALERGGSRAFAHGIYSGLGYAGQQAARMFSRRVPKHAAREQLEEMGLIMDISLADTLRESTKMSGGGLVGEAADVSALPTGRAVNIFFKANLLEPFTNFTRVIGLRTGERSIADTIKALDKKPQIMKRRLQELGLDPAQAKSWLSRTGGDFKRDDPYREAMKTSLTRFVNDVVMLPRPATKSLWMSDPRLALIAQLKSYQGTFGNTVGRRWLHKMGQTFKSDEDAMQTARMVGAAGLMTATAMMANELREQLRFGEKGDPKFKNESMKSKVFRAMDRAGLSGGLQPGVDLLFGQRFGKPGVVQALGPTVGQASDIVEGTAALAQQGKPERLQYQAISAIPGYNVLPSETKRKLRENLIESERN